MSPGTAARRNAPNAATIAASSPRATYIVLDDQQVHVERDVRRIGFAFAAGDFRAVALQSNPDRGYSKRTLSALREV